MYGFRAAARFYSALRVGIVGLGAATLCLATATVAPGQGTPVQVTDLNQIGGAPGVVSGFARLGDIALFAGEGPDGGVELWRTDGTEVGTHLVRDIWDGPTSSRPECLVAADTDVYFSADDGTAGAELWASDGTPHGTRRIADLYPGPQRSRPCNFVALDGQVIFTAGDQDGMGLWSTDGTAAGTLLLSRARHYTGDLTVHGSAAFFTANTTEHGTELWVTDGTAAGTHIVKDIRSGAASSHPRSLTSSPNGLLFDANDSGRSFWVTDGTEAGTTLLPTPGAPCGGIRRIGDEVYLSGDSAHTCAIWRTDGTAAGTTFLSHTADNDALGVRSFALLDGKLLYETDNQTLWSLDLTSGVHTSLLQSSACYIAFRELTHFDGAIFFTARWGERHWSLYRTDGTPEGTIEFPPYSENVKALASDLTVLGDRLLFAARDLEHGREPWITDGSVEGTEIVRDIHPSNSRGVGRLIPIRDRIFFQSTNEPSWMIKSPYEGSLRNPNAWSTTLPTGAPAPASWANATTYTSPVIGDTTRTFFLGRDRDRPIYDWALWVDDTVTGVTQKLTDFDYLRPGAEWAAFAGQGLLFGADDDDVYFTDGTQEGTLRLGSTGSPRIARVRDTWLFSVDGKLWRTDGTHADLRVLREDLSILRYSPLVTVGDVAFFFSVASPSTLELWKSDGTADGTERVRSLGPFVATSYYRPAVTRLGSELFFKKHETSGASSLWRSDGTASGTTKITDLPWNPFGPSHELITAGRTVFFAAYDDQHGVELWASDGTAAGTRHLRDIYEGEEGSHPTRLLALDDDLYFVARDPDHGDEPWFSDGTPEGTALIADLRAGPRSSNARDFLRTPAGVAFAANDGKTGKELYSTTCGNGVVDEGELCDAGERNASGSCCSASCRPVFATSDLGETCGLDLESVQLRRRPGRGERADRIVVKATLRPDTPVEPTGGLDLDILDGDRALLSIVSSELYCEARPRGWRCRSPDGNARVRLARRKNGTISIHARVRGVTLPTNVPGPLTVALGGPHHGSIRAHAANCSGNEMRLRCR